MERFTLHHADEPSLNRPILFVELSKRTHILDLLGMGDFLRYVLLHINLAGQRQRLRNRTGHWFEDHVRSFFVRELSLDPKQVIFRRKVVLQGSTPKQIDLAFVHNRVLYVVDCKAIAQDEEYIAGVHRKIRNRLHTFRKELDKCIQRAELIKAGAARNWISPTQFDTSLPLVCTPAVEYLPLDRPEFWIGTHLTVGTPEELLETIRQYGS